MCGATRDVRYGLLSEGRLFAPQDPSLMFIPEKGGRIRVFDQDTGNFLPDFVDLYAKVNEDGIGG
jgi:hypothetical protein